MDDEVDDEVTDEVGQAMKRACILKHVPFEGPGVFADVLREQGYTLETRLVPKEGLPEDGGDVLLVMGGPMSVNDPDPWIAEETAFIRRAIVELHKPVLGVCLGSQFMARALGGSVAAGPGTRDRADPSHAYRSRPPGSLLRRLPGTLRCDRVARRGHHRAAGRRGPGFLAPLPRAGAFVAATRAYGLLFHIEMDAPAIENLCRECSQDVTKAGLTAEEVMASVRWQLELLRQRARGLLTALLTEPL